MYHVASALFFAAVLVGAAAIIHMTLRQYWGDIVAALSGETPVRAAGRPWTKRVKVTVKPRPLAARAAQPRRAAA